MAIQIYKNTAKHTAFIQRVCFQANFDMPRVELTRSEILPLNAREVLFVVHFNLSF